MNTDHYGPLVREIIAWFLSQPVPAGYDHANTRRRLLTMFAAALGERPVLACHASDLTDWIKSHSDWRSAWTRRHNCILIKSAFNAAVRARVLARNPFESSDFAPGPIGRPVTEAEFRKLLDVSSRELRRVLLFCYHTGATPGEVRHLTPADVDLKRRVATLRAGGRPRLALLNDDAAAQLDVLTRQMMPTQTFVFVNTAGRPWSRTALAKAVRTARRRAKLPPNVTLYALGKCPLTPSPELPRPALPGGPTAFTIDAPTAGPAMFSYTDRGGPR